MTSGRPAHLPDFHRPPLNELVLSVQFGQLAFHNYHAGLIWQLFAADYPTVEEQPSIEPVFETFGPLAPADQLLRLELMRIPDTLRYWLVSEGGQELLQVQRDRLIKNWRQRMLGDVYPRYEPVRAKFANEISRAQLFFSEIGLGSMVFNQCEVSYINVIAFDDETDPNGRLEDMFTFWREEYSNSFLTKSERGNFSISYAIPSESGKEPLGRLHVSIQPAIVKADGRPATRLNLTARGKPADDTMESALAWLDRGREIVVTAFASITTEKMHRLWGRRDR